MVEKWERCYPPTPLSSEQPVYGSLLGTLRPCIAALGNGDGSVGLSIDPQTDRADDPPGGPRNRLLLWQGDPRSVPVGGI